MDPKANKKLTEMIAGVIRDRVAGAFLASEMSDLYESGNVPEGPGFCFDITFADGRSYNVEIAGPADEAVA